MTQTFDATLIKAPCIELIARFAERGQQLGRAHAHELIAAALGFWTYKLARDHAAPIIRFPKTTSANLRGPNPRHLALVTDRIERICGVDTWLAQGLAPIVIGTVRDHELYVDALAVLNDVDRDDAARLRLFKAIDDPNHDPRVDPIRATSAIARGLLPLPPPMTLDRLLQKAGPQMWGALDGVQNAAWLWVMPSAGSPDAHHAHADWYEARPVGRPAQLGFRVSIISTNADYWVPNGEPCYFVSSPVLNFNDPSRGWELYHPSRSALPRSRKDMQSAVEQEIGQPLTNLPRLVPCHRCLAVHLASDAHGAHECSPEFEAQALSAAIERVANRDPSAIISDAAFLDAIQQILGKVVDGATLMAYVREHAQGLRVRRGTGGWARIQPPNPPPTSRSNRPSLIFGPSLRP